jgi:hypothetical protein
MSLIFCTFLVVLYRFIVGVLCPPGYGSGVHREYFCFGGSCIMMDQFNLTYPRNLLKYPPEPNAVALKTRSSKSLNNIRIIFLCTVWEPNSHLLNLKVTRGSRDQMSDSAFQGRHCTLEIMLWQTGKQSFLFQASIFCCHRIMIWYSQAQRMCLSWGTVPLQITVMLVGWQWNWCYLWAGYVLLIVIRNIKCLSLTLRLQAVTPN